jgi:hypothetical protein
LNAPTLYGVKYHMNLDRPEHEAALSQLINQYGPEYIDHTYSANDLAQIGHDVEKITLVKALKLVFEERIFLSGNRAIIFE